MRLFLLAVTAQITGAIVSICGAIAVFQFWSRDGFDNQLLGIVSMIFPLYDLCCGMVNLIYALRAMNTRKIYESNCLQYLQITAMADCNMITPVCGILVLVLKSDPRMCPFLIPRGDRKNA